MQPAADRTDAVALVRGRGEQDPTPSCMYGRGSRIEPRVESTRSNAAGNGGDVGSGGGVGGGSSGGSGGGGGGAGGGGGGGGGGKFQAWRQIQCTLGNGGHSLAALGRRPVQPAATVQPFAARIV